MILLVATAVSTFGQDDRDTSGGLVQFALEAMPSAQIPVGKLGGIVRPAAGFTIGMEVVLSAVPWLSGGVSMAYAPAKLAPDGSLDTIIGGTMVQLTLPALRYFEVSAAAGGGYEYSVLEVRNQTFTGGGSYIEVRGATRWRAATSLALGMVVGYRQLFGVTGTVQVGATVRMKLG
jgi:hypothetical protein